MGCEPTSYLLDRVKEKFFLPSLHVFDAEDSIDSLDEDPVDFPRKLFRHTGWGYPDKVPNLLGDACAHGCNYMPV